MTAIIDYGVGNLFSLRSSFSAIGEEAVVTRNSRVLREADRLILPGVGAFRDARRAFSESGTEETVLKLVKQGRPLLGICLGMQMLFDRDYEDGVHEGLGLIPGEVRPISETIGKGLKIPQIGWNALVFRNPSVLYKYVNEGDYVYFVHSYYVPICKETIATADYILPYSASMHKDNFYTCQFHPEKSGKVGEQILKNFLEL